MLFITIISFALLLMVDPSYSADCKAFISGKLTPGSKITVRCQGCGATSEQTVLWFKDEQNITEYNNTGRYHTNFINILDGGYPILEIINSKLIDEGKYKCQVEGHDISKPEVIKFPPQPISNDPVNITIHPNEVATIKCGYELGPVQAQKAKIRLLRNEIPTALTWTYHPSGEAVQPELNLTYDQLYNDVNETQSVTVSYRCRIIGTRDSPPTYHIKLAPRVNITAAVSNCTASTTKEEVTHHELSYNTTNEFESGDCLKLNCTAQYPPSIAKNLSTHWINNLTGHEWNNRVLFIESLTKNDSGNYTCIVSYNGDIVQRESFQIIVKEISSSSTAKSIPTSSITSSSTSPSPSSSIQDISTPLLTLTPSTTFPTTNTPSPTNTPTTLSQTETLLFSTIIALIITLVIVIIIVGACVMNSHRKRNSNKNNSDNNERGLEDIELTATREEQSSVITTPPPNYDESIMSATHSPSQPQNTTTNGTIPMYFFGHYPFHGGPSLNPPAPHQSTDSTAQPSMVVDPRIYSTYFPPGIMNSATGNFPLIPPHLPSISIHPSVMAAHLYPPHTQSLSNDATDHHEEEQSRSDDVEQDKNQSHERTLKSNTQDKNSPH